MKRPPVVPPALESAIVELAHKYPWQAKVSVFSQTDYLSVFVVIRNAQVIRWSIRDYFCSIEQLLREFNGGDTSVVLLTWNSSTKLLEPLSDPRLRNTGPLTYTIGDALAAQLASRA